MSKAYECCALGAFFPHALLPPAPPPRFYLCVSRRRIRKSRPTVREDVLPRIKCIVVDEVDRLVDVLSKHAPTKEAEKRKRHARPIAALLERVLAANGEAQVRMMDTSVLSLTICLCR